MARAAAYALDLGPPTQPLDAVIKESSTNHDFWEQELRVEILLPACDPI